MREDLEKLADNVYKEWKVSLKPALRQHLDEETLCCFLDGRLSRSQSLRAKEHLLRCSDCAEVFASCVKLKVLEDPVLPKDLMDFAKGLIAKQESNEYFEIALRAIGAAWEVLNTTGRVMVGNEDLALAALRSRKIGDFKDEVVISKDFKQFRVEVKVENKEQKFFSLMVSVKKKNSGKTLKDLRIKLIKDNQELESYRSTSGLATFEHLMLGRYVVEISDIVKRLASVILKIKK